MRVSLPVIGVAIAVAGCAAHVAGNLQVDGAPFSPSMCESGQASGFAGVDLADRHGRRLRLVRALNGTLAGVYFPADGPPGQDFGACFSFNAHRGVGVVNGVRNVEGNAVLDCRTASHQVSGSVQFENCH